MEAAQSVDRQRLSEIVTLWTMVRQAHASTGEPDQVEAARRLLMDRYCTAAHRYLLGALRDEDAAEELFQEFALRFLRGDFRGTRASSGRFRDYLRTVLINLVTDHHRQRLSTPVPLEHDPPAPAPGGAWGDSMGVGESQSADSDATFVDAWRSELMDHAWVGLQRDNPQYYAVLLYHVTHGDAASAADAARELSKELGKAMTPQNVRVILHRARQRFADLLLSEVEASLDNPSREILREELTALRLANVCTQALERWQQKPRQAKLGPPGRAARRG